MKVTIAIEVGPPAKRVLKPNGVNKVAEEKLIPMLTGYQIW